MNKIFSIVMSILLCVTVTACNRESNNVMLPETNNSSMSNSNNDTNSNNDNFSNQQSSESNSTNNNPVHSHNFSSATCTTPKVCSCGAVEGSALGHKFTNATCTSAKKCTRCGDTEGSSLGHSFSIASCNSAKKCSRCGTTEGSALGHDYKNGVCERCYAKDPNYSSKYSFGDSFDFDSSSAKVNISIGNNYSFDVIDNHYSEYYKKTVIKIPATIKNIDTKTDILNMYNVQMYNINGNRSPREIYNYFDDGEILYTQMRPGAKVSGYFYILYEGDGTYYIEFSSGNDNIEVELAITK